MAPVSELKRTLDLSFEEALDEVPAALKTEGFGILTEIDVKETLKEKLGVDFRKYRILGACNPPMAHQALSAEMDIGLLLPCNVIVYEDEDEKTVVAAIDPRKTIAEADVEGVEDVAEEVRERLVRVLDALGR